MTHRNIVVLGSATRCGSPLGTRNGVKARSITMQLKNNWLGLRMSGTEKRTSYPVAVVVFALALVGYGCDLKKLVPPDNLDLGSLEVRTVTGGANIDPDGYQLEFRSGPGFVTGDIGANDTFTTTLGVGDWTVTLNDIAANCSVDANPQVVTVPGSGTGTVTFNITCS